MPPHTPTGAQHTISSPAGSAVAVELGGGLRSVVLGGRELLDGFAADQDVSAARGQPLIPWPNRLAGGRYSFAGRELRLPITEPEHNAALHGLVREQPFTAERHGDGGVVLHTVLEPRPGYPFTLGIRIAYRLDDAGLTVQTTATNVGAEPLPYGYGHHPYLAAPAGGVIDDAVLTAPGAVVLIADGHGIPTGRRAVKGAALDFRAGRVIGASRLDHAYTDLERDQQGRAWVTLTAADGRGAALWMDASLSYVQLFSGDTVAEGRRRQGLAVEPMTCPANALASGEGVRRLEPGEHCVTTWGLQAIG